VRSTRSLTAPTEMSVKRCVRFWSKTSDYRPNWIAGTAPRRGRWAVRRFSCIKSSGSSDRIAALPFRSPRLCIETALRLVKVAPVTLVFCRADRTWEFGRAVITKFKSLRLPLGRSPLFSVACAFSAACARHRTAASAGG